MSSQIKAKGFFLGEGGVDLIVQPRVECFHLKDDKRKEQIYLNDFTSDISSRFDDYAMLNRVFNYSV